MSPHQILVGVLDPDQVAIVDNFVLLPILILAV